MYKKFWTSWLVGVFFLVLALKVSAEITFDEPIFSPLAEQIPEDSPSAILYGQYLENGNYYLKEGLFDEARDLFWKAINLYPQNPDAYVNLGIVHLEQNDLESALRIFKEAEGLSGPDYLKREILLYNLGVCNFLKQDYTAAVSYLNMAVEEFAEFAQAYYYLGLSCHHLGQYQEAYRQGFIAAYLFAQSGESDTSLRIKQFLRNIQNLQWFDRIAAADMLLQDSRSALKAQQRDKAIALLEESIFLNPRNVKAYYELGLIYLRQAAFHNAIVYLHKAIEIEPNFMEAYLELNQAYRKVDKYDLAAEILKRAEEIDAKAKPPYSSKKIKVEPPADFGNEGNLNRGYFTAGTVH